METNATKKMVTIIMLALVLLVVIIGATGEEEEEVNNYEQIDSSSSSSPKLKACYEECYPKCKVREPLGCAAFCIGKCKQEKSERDNLCRCTYNCGKFRCANDGSDPEKILGCLSICSELCSVKY